MKKLVVLALCIVSACFALVGCDDTIAKDLDKYLNEGYDDVEVREEVELDLYIIIDEAANGATETVNQAIDKYTSDKYKVSLDIHYIKAADYKAAVLDGVKAADADKKADIVLINSKELYDELMAGGYLAPLDSYLDSDTITNYKLINKNIPKIKKDVPDSLWNAVADNQTDGNSYFVVPNNRLIGEYTYLQIDRAQFFANSHSELEFEADNFDAYAFMVSLQAEGISCSIKTGKYSDIKYQREDADRKQLCIILEKPTVDAEYAFESAFGVVKGTGLEDRAIEIIYAINTEKQLRNLLQYGDVLTHYNIVNGDIVYNTGADAEIYRMNLLYTGNILTADYCSAIGWDAFARANAEVHNKDAVYVPAASGAGE